jgi:hypothetical protein
MGVGSGDRVEMIMDGGFERLPKVTMSAPAAMPNRKTTTSQANNSRPIFGLAFDVSSVISPVSTSTGA